MTQKPSKQDLSDEIDANLRRVYEDALNEQLPDRFLDLLNKLKSGDTSSSDAPQDSGDA